MCETVLQELSQLCRRPELRDGIQFLERRRERVRKTPDGPRPEFLILWLEVQIMHRPGQMFGSFQFALDERFVDDHLRGDIGEFASLPRFDLLTHGLEVPLHPVDSDRDAIYK